MNAARPLGTPVAARPAASRAGVVKMFWHIYPRDFSDSNFHDKDRRRPGKHGTAGSTLNKEYNIEPGQHQALGSADINGPSTVDPQQCVIQVAEDGSCCYAWAQGTQPTLWRTRPDEPWNWMQPGESVVLQSGWKISLDCNNPETAVFKFEKAGRFAENGPPGFQGNVVPPPAGQGFPHQQGGGFPQTQPVGAGMPQQGYPQAQPAGLPQQGGFPPQQGGYAPQQGGYPQQGGFPQQGGYPPQQGGYPPQQGGFPQQGGY
jgi:hypothetical protein